MHKRHVLNILFAKFGRKWICIFLNHLSKNIENHNHPALFNVLKKDLFSKFTCGK
jgi:hypothetical protein